ncbi:hypothetical protein [Ilumatobacter coccineus]|jgi:hypothetical protein|uniref:Uncharacterized protein n=1 Tax=Ilumatobacter coccineus (strain NBRC 103263 / KCTC 29153 / YM16-304) TaxID=1313172 RepID=A0A6C7EIY3_ILUCY|nr:hypothetical protein [Ilumatobacter coccineus]BAN04498.1 hypothetical protein YM304_41840 [Ilumatobacter coccineus YM16-304]
MASRSKSGSARTAPKGRATASRNEARSGRSFLSPTMEWVLAVVVFLLVLAAIFYFFGDIRSTLGGTTSPADVSRDVAVAAATVT